MPRKYIPKSVKEEVEKRAGGYCEYCKFLRKYAYAFAYEHIIPIALGGSNEPDNLAYSCLGCNSFKQAAITATDPESGEIVSLFHPRKEKWADHFSWSEDTLQIVGLTATGRATIEKLQTNREASIHFRKLLLMSGEHPPE
ncbi:MAG: HNH endonuclease signature motif containing protein [Bacteroidota bacterium]